MSYRVCNPSKCVRHGRWVKTPRGGTFVRGLKRGKKAPRRNVMQSNRRLVTLETFLARGPATEQTQQLVEKERQYHFTKGHRTRNK